MKIRDINVTSQLFGKKYRIFHEFVEFSLGGTIGDDFKYSVSRERRQEHN